MSPAYLADGPLAVAEFTLHPSVLAATMFVCARASTHTMLIVQDQTYFDEVVAFAKKTELYEPSDDIENKNGFLKNRLDYLEQYGKSDKTRVRLLPDGAPYCFYFVIEQKNSAGEWERLFNGGLLFHGPHDGLGSGSGPTFACTLTPTVGWSIHT